MYYVNVSYFYKENHKIWHNREKFVHSTVHWSIKGGSLSENTESLISRIALHWIKSSTFSVVASDFTVTGGQFSRDGLTSQKWGYKYWAKHLADEDAADKMFCIHLKSSWELIPTPRVLEEYLRENSRIFKSPNKMCVALIQNYFYFLGDGIRWLRSWLRFS